MKKNKVKVEDVFGKLTVVADSGERHWSSIVWVCRCECGNFKKVPTTYLTTGTSTHCGCSTPKRKPKDITGKKLNKLTAIRNTGNKSPNGDYLWEFKCDCGGATIVSIGNFNSGHTKSCGCALKGSVKDREDYHGMQDTPEYNSWRKMRERCYNKEDIMYPAYGGKGVVVCERWKESFELFLEDMGTQPFKGCTIDRKDISGGYSPDNCRWASKYVQSRNQYSYKGSSQYKGVQYEASSNKWIATISVGDIKARKIGRYVTEDHAAKAYNMASELIFGEDCPYLTLNPVDKDYSCVKTNCKFFKYWLPLMIEEKNEKYVNDINLLKDEDV